MNHHDGRIPGRYLKGEVTSASVGAPALDGNGAPEEVFSLQSLKLSEAAQLAWLSRQYPLQYPQHLRHLLLPRILKT